jgi:hypothetical protein
MLLSSCQKAEVRGVQIRALPAESPTLDVLQIVVLGEERGKQVEFEVSGTRLSWSFYDLDDDGKEDLTISSETHASYFAKFLIQDGEPRLRLLDREGIAVVDLGEQRPNGE